MTGRVERPVAAFARHDVARRRHRAGDDADDAAAGWCRALAVHDHVACRAVGEPVPLAPREVVVVLDVEQHLRAQRPFGIDIEVHPGPTGNGYAARTDGPAYTAARAAWSAAWGADVVLAGSGGSIPIVSALGRALPDAEALLVGTTDGFANIHGPDERLLLSEFENATAAEADFLGRYAEAFAR